MRPWEVPLGRTDFAFARQLDWLTEESEPQGLLPFDESVAPATSMILQEHQVCKYTNKSRDFKRIQEPKQHDIVLSTHFTVRYTHVCVKKGHLKYQREYGIVNMVGCLVEEKKRIRYCRNQSE